MVSAVGLLLALVWLLWTRHNDYWHSVWTGTLIEIEKNHLGTKARVFDQVHGEIARAGGRSDCLMLGGHKIAQLVPLVFCIGWIATLCFSAYMLLPICKWTSRTLTLQSRRVYVFQNLHSFIERLRTQSNSRAVIWVCRKNASLSTWPVSQHLLALPSIVIISNETIQIKAS